MAISWILILLRSASSGDKEGGGGEADSGSLYPFGRRFSGIPPKSVVGVVVAGALVPKDLYPFGSRKLGTLSKFMGASSTSVLNVGFTVVVVGGVDVVVVVVVLVVLGGKVKPGGSRSGEMSANLMPPKTLGALVVLGISSGAGWLFRTSGTRLSTSRSRRP